MSYSHELVDQVWNDKTGERIEVGSDLDGLGLVEIRSYDDQGNITARLTMPKGQAELVAKALANQALL